MSKAISYALVLAFVLLLGTHPGTLTTLFHHFLTVLQRAGDELSSFVNDL